MNIYQYAPNPVGWIDPLGLARKIYALFTGESKKPYYIGKTDQPIDMRMGQHQNSGRYTDNTRYEVLQDNLTKPQQKAYEQKYMEVNKTKTGSRGSDLSESATDKGNKINAYDKNRTDANGKSYNAEYDKLKDEDCLLG